MKKERLQKEFHIDMGGETGKELDLMCNLSGYVEKCGVERGLEQGLEQGIEKGKLTILINMLNNQVPRGSIKQMTNVTDEELARAEELRRKLQDSTKA